MKLLRHTLLATALMVGGAAVATPTVSGDYLELRTCDVMVGQCFANGDIGLRGKEAVMVWSVNEGSFDGVALDGLHVMALVRAKDTLGDLKYNAAKSPESVIVTDEKANEAQREALIAMAKNMGGALLSEVIATKSRAMNVDFSTDNDGLAKASVGDVFEVSARPFFKDDGCCGHESPYYPPLTKVEQAEPAVAEVATITDNTLNCTWKSVDSPNMFLGKFQG